MPRAQCPRFHSAPPTVHALPACSPIVRCRRWVGPSVAGGLAGILCAAASSMTCGCVLPPGVGAQQTAKISRIVGILASVSCVLYLAHSALWVVEMTNSMACANADCSNLQSAMVPEGCIQNLCEEKDYPLDGWQDDDDCMAADLKSRCVRPPVSILSLGLLRRSHLAFSALLACSLRGHLYPTRAILRRRHQVTARRSTTSSRTSPRTRGTATSAVARPARPLAARPSRAAARAPLHPRALSTVRLPANALTARRGIMVRSSRLRRRSLGDLRVIHPPCLLPLPFHLPSSPRSRLPRSRGRGRGRAQQIVLGLIVHASPVLQCSANGRRSASLACTSLSAASAGPCSASY